MKRLDGSHFLEKTSIFPVLSSIHPIFFHEKDLGTL